MLIRLLASLSIFSALPATATEQAWVQLGPHGAEVRAITSTYRCPVALIDGEAIALRERSAPSTTYPVRTCQLTLPGAAQKVLVYGRPIALPSKDPQTIVILGDTGCRMKGKPNAGGVFQACNDPQSWPFSLIAEVAAQQKPDLVIHVGDYHYREVACPDSATGCTGSPWGDSLAVWEADLLQPAHTLLYTAPWVFVRGNHEECTRGGKGWSRLFDPYAFDAAQGCNAMGAPWMAKFNGFNLGIIDNSSIDEGAVDPTVRSSLNAQLRTLDEQSGDTPWWAVMHRPARSVIKVSKHDAIGGNETLAAAFDTSTPSRLEYVWSGHLHAFEVMNWADGGTPQIVTGHGGDVLDRGVPSNLDGLVQLGKQIATGWGQAGDFGFVMLKRHIDQWELTNHDRFGAITMRCTLGQPIRCQPAH